MGSTLQRNTIHEQTQDNKSVIFVYYALVAVMKQPEDEIKV